jgi:hypothetical protein
MLDPDSKPDVTLDVPAISVQLSTTIGANRSLTLTTGLAMDCPVREFNELLDKLTAASDRQKKRHDLEQTRALLKNEEQNLHLHRQQLVLQENKFRAEYATSGRKGDWEPKGGQKGVLDGLTANEKTSRERIEQLRKGIAEMEAECR